MTRNTVKGYPIVRVVYVNSDPPPGPNSYGYGFVWYDLKPPAIGALAYDQVRDGNQRHRKELGVELVRVIGYGTEYKGHLRKLHPLKPARSKGEVDARKVMAAVLTAGLSLPFTRGIRKRRKRR